MADYVRGDDDGWIDLQANCKKYAYRNQKKKNRMRTRCLRRMGVWVGGKRDTDTSANLVSNIREPLAAFAEMISLQELSERVVETV